MCARGAQIFSWQQLFDHMAIEGQPPEGGLKRFNVSPSTRIGEDTRWTRLPAVTLNESGQREVHGMIWPLIPFWCQGELPRFSTANCRSEPDEPFTQTLKNKPAFRDAWGKNRRCLIPFSWFYEWDQRSKPKKPWMISLKNHEIMVMAGLWDVTETPSQQTLLSCTIVTTAPNQTLTDIGHHRAPVILPSGTWDEWLSGSAAQAQTLLQPVDSDLLETHPISTQINNPQYQADPRTS
ncbi:MAG TPA: SOS response-associated peptidase [Wenzhouxiangella sp.]